MSWDGTERRQDYINLKERLGSIEISIGILTNKIENLNSSKNTSHDRIYEMLSKHSDSIYGNGQEGLVSKIRDISSVKKNLEGHYKVDMWMFGLVITMNMAIIVKLFIG